MAIRDKTQLKAQSLQRKSPLHKNAQIQEQPNIIKCPLQQIQPNYYPSVASVDSSSIESTCIFPKKLNKMHKRMCGNYK